MTPEANCTADSPGPEPGHPRPDVPRPEHPRPQLVRPEWLSLNGTWQFEIDQGDSGLERGLVAWELADTITVPFAPESELSGVENTDFLEAVWYRRTVTVPHAWAGRRILLHFGAVDHDATVWINNVEAARHSGGFSSFSVDVTDHAEAGEDAVIVVRARDPRDALQARGKQATWYSNTHCNYTRTTGIWQTVWLEAVGRTFVRRLAVTPNLAAGSFSVATTLNRNAPGTRLVLTLSDAAGVVAETNVRADLDLTPSAHLAIDSDRIRPWTTEDPHLYSLTVAVMVDGVLMDEVASYAGLRSISIDGQSVLINGEWVFQRLVLDQGYWPASLMTAPSDEALVRDIELSMAAGFNGARLHQKVVEERFLYHADRLGYLVWGEFGDWGVAGQGKRGDNQQPTAGFVAQWLEVLARDVNHPSIIGWCPLNETHQLRHDRNTQLDDVTRAIFDATKLADPSRPVIDASGYSHRVPGTDVYDSHSYEQDPSLFAEQMSGLTVGDPYRNAPDDGEWSLPYAGQPYFVSEFGGIWWNADAAAASGSDVADSWGYGERVRNEEEFYERFEGLTRVLLDDPRMFGYCYTQLTDVFQEQNGIYDFDRNAKFDMKRIRAAQQRPAAYEKG